MAKKKRKPVNHKQSQRTHLSKMSSTDVFAAQAKECFKEQIHNAKENENIDKTLFEGLDYDPVRQKRRIQAILNTLEI